MDDLDFIMRSSFIEVTSTATVSVSNDNRSNNATIDVSAAEYMERLKVLRARCGLDNSNLDSGSNPRTDSTSSSESVGIRSDTARMQSSNITSSLPSQLVKHDNCHNKNGAVSVYPVSQYGLWRKPSSYFAFLGSKGTDPKFWRQS